LRLLLLTAKNRVHRGGIHDAKILVAVIEDRQERKGEEIKTRTVVLSPEFGVFVRSAGQLDRARAAVKEAGIAFKILVDHVETTCGHISISTMHLTRGLEFRAVVVTACDDEVIPLQERTETVGDDSDLQEVYDTERHLLYVACTRARNHLLVTGIEPVSEFLDDIVKADRHA
jgi:superfamily I DNA/RNA helicase